MFFNKKLALLGAGLLLSGGLFFSPRSAEAQVACFGDGCSVSPIPASAFNDTLAAFKVQFADPLAKDMVDASVLAGIGSVPMGGINMDGWTIGLGAIGTVQPESFTNVVVPNVGTYLNVKTVGVGLSPRIYGGVNLGMFFDRTPMYRVASRFEVYLSFFDAKYTYGGEQKIETLSSGFRPTDRTKISAYYRGIDLRYQLVKRDRNSNPLFRWNGMNLGIGLHQTRQDISYYQVNSSIQIAQFSGGQIVWNGNNQATMKTDLTSVPIEFMTGIQLLYFMNLNVGGGVSINKGSTNFSVNRYGPVFLASDLDKVIGTSVPDANLFLNVPGDGPVEQYTPFGRVGITFNIWVVKLDIEAMTAGNVRGVQVGLRTEF
ncbi:MAG: hypothetical protein KDK23_09910 [Leptospiraceae bacterium]|nr:hypothetical protein [Leptospiraceae bacterium]